jgi:hypothetical protein
VSPDFLRGVRNVIVFQCDSALSLRACVFACASCSISSLFKFTFTIMYCIGALLLLLFIGLCSPLVLSIISLAVVHFQVLLVCDS